MPTTIFTSALGTDDSGNEGFSFRNILLITGNAQGQIRVTFKAASAGTFKVDHASIGIYSGSGSANTTATPVELLFSGAHGFTVSNGATITSDWADLAGFTSANNLVVIEDFNSGAGSGAESQNPAAPNGNTLWYQASSASYNQSVAGLANVLGSIVVGVSLIEVQASPAAGGGGTSVISAINRPGQGPSRGLRAVQAFPPSAAAQALTLSAATGTYVISGLPQTLNSARSIAAVQGTCTISGKAQTLNRGINIAAAVGAYTVGGVAQFFGVGMPAAQGSYSLNGQAVVPAIGMPAGTGAFSVSGQPQAFAVALSIKPAAGAYTVTGNAVGLSLTPSGSSNAVHGNPFLASPGLMTSIP